MRNAATSARIRIYAYAKYLGFASFRKYDFAGFRKLSHTFANIVSQFFAIAVFRNISQYFAIAVSQRYRKVSQIDFARFRKRETLVFSRGFAMGSLLTWRDSRARGQRRLARPARACAVHSPGQGRADAAVSSGLTNKLLFRGRGSFRGPVLPV